MDTARRVWSTLRERDGVRVPVAEAGEAAVGLDVHLRLTQRNQRYAARGRAHVVEPRVTVEAARDQHIGCFVQ